MNTRQFQIFLIVCDSGSMTAAAKILFMTQPSVSQVISELEKEYGVHLFERLKPSSVSDCSRRSITLICKPNIAPILKQAKKRTGGFGRRRVNPYWCQFDNRYVCFAKHDRFHFARKCPKSKYLPWLTTPA